MASNPATDWKGLHSLRQPAERAQPERRLGAQRQRLAVARGGAGQPEGGGLSQAIWTRRARILAARMPTLLLTGSKGWTLEGLRAAAYDSYLPAFAVLHPATRPLPSTRCRPTTRAARDWPHPSPSYGAGIAGGARPRRGHTGCVLGRCAVANTGRSVSSRPADDHAGSICRSARSPRTRSQRSMPQSTSLMRDFGDWRVPWGEINRFQRLDDSIYSPSFDDAAPSRRRSPSPRRSGAASPRSALSLIRARSASTAPAATASSHLSNSGPRVRAMAVTAGGESGDPRSPHFADQAQRYATGNLRPVYFYPDQLGGHIERRYRPGE